MAYYLIILFIDPDHTRGSRECFLIGQNKTKHANFRGSPLVCFGSFFRTLAINSVSDFSVHSSYQVPAITHLEDTNPDSMFVNNSLCCPQIRDMAYYLIILFIAVTSYGVVRQAVQYQNETVSWTRTLRNVWFYPYWMIYGELFAEEIDRKCWIL